MDIPRLDAWSLHCFAVLVRESNVTRAGAALDLSQPAASAILARLRDTFQDPILVKSSSGMVPTPKAIEIAARAERLLEEMRELLRPAEPAFDPSRFSGAVSFAAADVVRLLVLPRIMQALQREAPGLSIDTHHADRIRIHEKLERADVDLGLGPQVVSTGRLHYREIWCDEPAVLTRAGTAAARAQLDPAGFAALGHIRVVPSRPSYFDEVLDKELAAAGLRRRLAMSERSFLMLPSLIEATELVAVVPQRFARYACERHGLEMFAPPLPIGTISLGLYWHERTHREPLFRWLRWRIAELAGATGTAAPSA
ncbi:LysR family transcriptional regulator [Bordetella sp. BOR01]|uniref:LysR family transcriptional regulator n=1 Tax=Bordetella sp. BOR01 TaxID=2854779 RepID=UPI001C455EF4|nr:LysR family transcriptional regulator [Bordetella sp. BOR01]MBV7486842.1 LysR family transcriptional regulator [Bordetella sp. BOR01]